VKRGEIRWAEHPDWPRRPVLILTRDEAIDHLNAVFVVLATTNIRGLATEVALGTEDGMPRPCVLSADNTATIAKSYLRQPITTLSSTKLREVCQALSHATGC